MALTYRTLCLSSQQFRNLTKPVKWSVDLYYSPVRILSNSACYRSIFQKPGNVYEISLPQNYTRKYCANQSSPNAPTETKKPGLYQRLKAMYKDYWYVVVPVHLVTSAMWFGTFYYLVRSGLDVLSLLESLGISEKLLTPLRDSGAGNVAFAFALYKLMAPLRYATTLGATTFAIRRLTKLGVIKPVPSKQRIKEIIQEKKDNFQEYQVQMKEKRNHVMDEMRRYKQNMKDRVKKM